VLLGYFSRTPLRFLRIRYVDMALTSYYVNEILEDRLYNRIEISEKFGIATC
jgi:hypothetical protein